MIQVLQPGLLTTIQDSGRRGYENYGMPASGAVDPFLGSIANKLVGNEWDAPLLEFALVGPTLKFLKDCHVAISGFSILYLLEGRRVSEFGAFSVRAGSVLEFAGMESWFGYLAIEGGIQAEQILGSASACLSAKIGKRLEKGSVLTAGVSSGKFFIFKKDFLPLLGGDTVRILPALHTALFPAADLEKFASEHYRISPQSNRTGIRLNGNAVEQPHVRRSAPSVAGTIQIPRAGQPVILGPEGPTTGGYPQIAVISLSSWTKLARTRPGQSIRFEWTDRLQAKQISEYRNSIFRTEEAWERI